MELGGGGQRSKDLKKILIYFCMFTYICIYICKFKYKYV